jgi:hypothetical protein
MKVPSWTAAKRVSKELADELNTKSPVTVTTVQDTHSLGDAIISRLP